MDPIAAKYVAAGLATIGMCGASLAVAILGAEAARVDRPAGSAGVRLLRIYTWLASFFGLTALAVTFLLLFAL